jgi:hypothetical protein
LDRVGQIWGRVKGEVFEFCEMAQVVQGGRREWIGGGPGTVPYEVEAFEVEGAAFGVEMGPKVPDHGEVSESFRGLEEEEAKKR